MIKKIWKFPLLKMLVEIVLFFVALYLVKEYAIKPITVLLPFGEDANHNIQGALTLVFAFLAYNRTVRFVEKRAVSELAMDNFARIAGSWFGVAFALLSVVILVLWVLGYFRITGLNPLSGLPKILVWIPQLAITEEMIFRGFIYRTIEKNYGLFWALAVSAAVFGIMHITNDNADWTATISATAGGLLLGVLYTMTKALWAPIFFHIGWNFAQIFYGVTMSGVDEFGHVFRSSLEGPQWLTGGDFGPESSWLTIGLVLVAFLVILKRVNRPDGSV